MCLGGGSAPQAPNTSANSAASSAIGNEAQAAGTGQLAWAQGQVGNNSQTNSGIQQSLTPQVGTDVGANAAGAGMYGSTLGGLGQQMQTAQQYGNAAGQNQAAANAQATTAAGFDAARMNNQRQLGSYGVDPSQMKSGALNLNANLAQAGAVGNAGYQAGQQRQLTGMGLVSNALNQNMMGASVGQGYGAGANQTGQTTAGIGNQTLGANSSALSAPSQMLQTGLSGQSTASNIENQTFGNQMASYNANQQGANSLMSGIGTVAGIAGMAMMSDGGAIPGRNRFAKGGEVASIPQGPGVTPVMASAGAQMPETQSPVTGALNGIQSGMQTGSAIRGRYDQSQANSMLPGTNATIQNDPSMQSLQNPQMQQPEFGRPSGDPAASTLAQINAGSGEGMIRPGFADGGQTKHMDYGNPAVHPSQGIPPQVGIPGPWVAANGGSPPGMIQHGMSDGSGIDDQVHAKVSVGEYIIPADVVHAKGKEFFDMLLKKYHMPAQQQRQQMGVH
jgi:hypothetical protein